MNISVFGTGYVGLVMGAGLANLGHQVICVDVNAQKINQIQQGKIPFYEPGLKELVAQTKEKGKLRFITNVQEGVTSADIILNCVGTPSRNNGAADLTFVFQVAETVARYAQGQKLLINKSTVPPGTAKQCSELIQKINPISGLEVISNPEFLAEGKAVYDFNHPDKIVVGANSDRAFALVRKMYMGRMRTYIPFLETDWETAEMIKYANNCFLATKISFVNEIANICDKVGANFKVVAQAMGMDYRIGPKFLNAGVGYGGSCFPKDVRALIAVAEEKGYEPALLREVDMLNERQKKILLQKITHKFNGQLPGKVFTIWGASFKPQTSDVREAPSLVLIRELLEKGARIKVYDPVALEELRQVFGDAVSYCSSIADSVAESSSVILLTEWDEFRTVNFQELAKVMKEKVIFDGRNIYEPELIQEEGFEYYGIGRS